MSNPTKSEESHLKHQSKLHSHPQRSANDLTQIMGNVGANKPAAAADSYGPRVQDTSTGPPEYGKPAHRIVFQNGQIHLIGSPQSNLFKEVHRQQKGQSKNKTKEIESRVSTVKHMRTGMSTHFESSSSLHSYPLPRLSGLGCRARRPKPSSVALPADFHRSVSIKLTNLAWLIGPSQLCVPLDIAWAFTYLYGWV